MDGGAGRVTRQGVQLWTTLRLPIQ
jgi:hypothetical protein